jgi:hypothetical protein
MATGYVTQPHTTGSAGTASLRVQNSDSSTDNQIQWRYKLGAGSYSPYWEQNTTRSGLTAGTYTVNFKMKNSGTGHTPPPNEAVTLSSGEIETLVVGWT